MSNILLLPFKQANKTQILIGEAEFLHGKITIGDFMAHDWSEYQEEAAEFFRTLGLEAATNVTIKGVRTSHDIDVVVKSKHAGFEVTWVVECKYWRSRVSKLHILALREIVSDIGADRGILLAESGFQSGALEAAVLTNVHLTSLANARLESRADVFSMRLTELYDRVEKCREMYWDISKNIRMEYGLRPGGSESGYSGASVISLAEDVLRKGFRGSYPFEPDYMWGTATKTTPEFINSVEDVFNFLEPLIHDLEIRIHTCNTAIAQDSK